MIRIGLLAGLLAFGTAFPARAAGDPSAVSKVEPFLRDDEKALLAAVLSNSAAASEFNADVKFAADDAKVMKLVLDKWRGRIVAFAEKDVRIATPNLEGTYKNSSSMMTPQTRAYLLRRLKTMKEGDRNNLIEYLSAVDDALASNDGKLTWYTKKVVSGIFDRYRQDLGEYLPVPLAQSAKASAPSAERALADLRREAEAVVAAPPARSTHTVAGIKPPVRTAPARTAPVVDRSTPTVQVPAVVVSSSTAALDQARRAAEAAERSGEVFDGGGVPPPETGEVVDGRGSSGPPRLAPPSKPVETPTLVAEVPSPADPDEDFMSRIKKLKTGPASAQPRQYLPAATGGALGAVLGFLLGGPLGAVIGAGAGLFAGKIIGNKLFQ